MTWFNSWAAVACTVSSYLTLRCLFLVFSSKDVHNLVTYFWHKKMLLQLFHFSIILSIVRKNHHWYSSLSFRHWLRFCFKNSPSGQEEEAERWDPAWVSNGETVEDDGWRLITASGERGQRIHPPTEWRTGAVCCLGKVMITAASTLLPIRNVAKNIEGNEHYIRRMVVIVFKSPELNSLNVTIGFYIWPTHAKQTLQILIAPTL